METNKDKMYRTLIEVYSLNRKGYKIQSPGWNSRLKFNIPHNSFSEDQKKAISDSFLNRKQVLFFVETNIGADLVTELKFRNFELAPEPRFKTIQEYFPL